MWHSPPGCQNVWKHFGKYRLLYKLKGCGVYKLGKIKLHKILTYLQITVVDCKLRKSIVLCITRVELHRSPYDEWERQEGCSPTLSYLLGYVALPGLASFFVFLKILTTCHFMWYFGYKFWVYLRKCYRNWWAVATQREEFSKSSGLSFGSSLGVVKVSCFIFIKDINQDTNRKASPTKYSVQKIVWTKCSYGPKMWLFMEAFFSIHCTKFSYMTNT